MDPGVKRSGCVQAKEGVIQEGSPAWAAMSGADRTKRRRAADELQTKLRSPNFFVSRTRLCVRNLPYSLEEKQLKELLVAAVRASSTAACCNLPAYRAALLRLLFAYLRALAAEGKDNMVTLSFVRLEESDAPTWSNEHDVC